MVIQETERGRPGSSLEIIPNSSLRHRIRKIEDEMQRYDRWPIRSNFVAPLFHRVFGLDRWDVDRVLEACRKREVIDFIEKEGEKGKISYFLDKDHVGALGVLCSVIGAEPRRKGKLIIVLDYDVKNAQEALGNHPWREILHDPLPNNSDKPNNRQKTTKDARKPVTEPPSFSHNGDTRDGKPRDAEEVLIESIEAKMREKSAFSSIPFFEKDELERAQFWTLEALKALFPTVPDGFEEVSYLKIPLLNDDSGRPHFFRNPEAKMVMFISAAYATDRRELAKLDQLLEELNYRQLRFGLARSIRILKICPDLGQNLTELFYAAIKHVEENRLAQPKVLVGNTTGPNRFG